MAGRGGLMGTLFVLIVSAVLFAALLVLILGAIRVFVVWLLPFVLLALIAIVILKLLGYL